MIEVQPDKIIEKITNKKTGEEYKNDKEWKDKGILPEDIRRDVAERADGKRDATDQNYNSFLYSSNNA